MAEELACERIDLGPRPRGPRTFDVQWVGTWVGLGCGAAVMAAGVARGTHGRAGGFVAMLTLLICGLAALFDAATARIPNRLTYGAILAGLALNALGGLSASTGNAHADMVARWLSCAGPAQSVLGFAVCAAVGVAGFALARIGGGDIKLLAAVGALLGLSQTGAVMIVALTVAVVYALLNLFIAGRLNVAARLAAGRLLEAVYLRKLDLAPPPGETRLAVPMAVPLAIGVAAAQIVGLRALLGGHG